MFGTAVIFCSVFLNSHISLVEAKELVISVLSAVYSEPLYLIAVY